MLADDPKRLKIFFGLFSLQKRSHRRVYVLADFLLSFLCLALLPVFFARGKGLWLAWMGLLLLQNLYLFNNRPGIQRGPVKSFTGEWRAVSFYPDMWKLPNRIHIQEGSSVSSWRNPDFTPGLDERETMDRNRVHYLAFRILQRVLPLAALTYSVVVFLMRHQNPARLLGSSAAFFWAVVVFTINLPHAYILWTEPDVDFEVGQPISEEKTISFGS